MIPGKKQLFAFLALLCALTAFLPVTALADVFSGPCAIFSVPRELALAIARVESDGYPYALNIGGRDHRPRSREEAARLASSAIASGRSVDVGLMQINDWWLRRLGISPYVALEPGNNVLLGLWILHQEMRRRGRVWKAVGAYHSPREERQRVYARKVARQYTLLTGQKVRAAPHDPLPEAQRKS